MRPEAACPLAKHPISGQNGTVKQWYPWSRWHLPSQWLWGPAFLSALLAAATFAITLRGTYIYDDVALVQDDPRVSDPHLWGQFWTKPYILDSIDNLYRPLTSMSYAIQWWLHGDRPWAFHLVNVLLAAASAAAVAELARRLAGAKVALVAGLLFAVHPLHVEAVAGIVGRAELLCTLAFVLGLILYLPRPLTGRRVAAIVACYAIAVLSKEQGLLLPPLLLCWGIVRRWREQREQPSLGASLASPASPASPAFPTAPAMSPAERQATLWLFVGLCWLSAGYIIFREWMLPWSWDRGSMDWSIQPMIRAVGIDRWLMPIVLLGRYTALLLFPHHLSIDYGGLVIGWHARANDPYLWLGFAALVTWAVLLLLTWWRRNAVAVLCLIGLAATYAIVGNVVSLIGTNFGERLMYLPSAFFLILIALALAQLPARALVPLVAIALSAGAWRSISYAATWNDRLSFYHQSLAHQPKSIRLHLLDAYELMAQGHAKGNELWEPPKDAAEARRLVEAADILRRGRELLPDYWDVWTFSGYVAMKLNDLDAARDYFQRAFDLAPNPMYFMAARAEVLQRIQERDKADKPAPTSAPATTQSSSNLEVL